jgi:hypothetical protein
MSGFIENWLDPKVHQLFEKLGIPREEITLFGMHLYSHATWGLVLSILGLFTGFKVFAVAAIALILWVVAAESTPYGRKIDWASRGLG